MKMYNKAIISEQIKTYGIEATEKFCEMEANKYRIIAESCPTGSDEELEALYEHNWWVIAKEQLSDRINKKENNVD